MENEIAEEFEQQPEKSPTKPIWERLLLPAISIVLIASILWLGIQQNQNSQAQNKQQREIALSIAIDQQRETTLLNYRDKIADLMVNDKLLQAHPADASTLVADAYTSETLRKLDPDRKAELMRFLYQTKLISNDTHIINMTEDDLHGAHMANIDIRDTYLVGINLSGADLHGAILSDATLTFANLTGANLTKTDFQASDMHNVNLTGANLAGANLRDALGLNTDLLARAQSLAGTILPDGSVHR
jgi:uncharacterized protein YjbI with pentapeptide repeats